MERKISFKNLYLVGVISLGLIGLGVGSTFAMFTASAEINDSISLTSGLNYQDDIVDLVDMTISSNKVETATLNITNNTTKTLNYTSWYKTNNNNLQIGTVVSNNYSVTGTIEPNASAQIIVSIRNRGTGVAKVTVGISASESDIVVSDGITTLPTDPLPPYLNDYITNLYTSNTKSDVTNNSITYHYASSVNLMNDRLGDTEIGIDDGNIRYYGATPNNYIDIGDRTSNDEVILYRVIGVFDNKVKVIRNESIGNYSWDTSSTAINSGWGINEWSVADLMKLLNPGYENNTGIKCDYDTDLDMSNCTNEQIKINNSLWYNSQSGRCYHNSYDSSKECDFTSIGLSEEVKRIISSNIFYTGGISNNNEWNLFAKAWYAYERGTNTFDSNTPCYGNSNCNDNITRTTKWTGKVGLPYPSDYGYAADLNICKEKIKNYDATDCKENNWIYNGNIQYTITPSDSYPSYAYVISETGKIKGYSVYTNSSEIRPTFYLTEKAVLESGTGTLDDPFVVD